jgi:hypothetical protein
MTLASWGPTARNYSVLVFIRLIKISKIDETTTKKSNLFHAFWKYVSPYAINLSTASMKNIVENM